MVVAHLEAHLHHQLAVQLANGHVEYVLPGQHQPTACDHWTMPQRSVSQQHQAGGHANQRHDTEASCHGTHRIHLVGVAAVSFTLDTGLRQEVLPMALAQVVFTH